MERINDCIQLEYSTESKISNSYGELIEHSQSFVLHYYLQSNDCFFDLHQQDYHLKIEIQKSYFEKYNESLNLAIERQTICCNTQSKILDIIQCKLQGIQRHIFVESAVLYLIFQFQKNPLVFQLSCDTCDIANRPLDIDKLDKAKEYILQNLSLNLTIPIIATHIGTNQCYLKKGFKDHTGLTIFEYIQENRMIKAKHLLSNSEMSMMEVATNTGYGSVSSFSQAFKNYFGTNPSQYSKSNIAR